MNHVVMLFGSRTVPDAKGLMCLIEALKLAPYPQRQHRQIVKEMDIFRKVASMFDTTLIFI